MLLRSHLTALALAAGLLAAGSGAVLAARAAQDPARPDNPAKPEKAKPRGEKPEEPLPPLDLSEADRFFAIADYDGGGWISYREASKSLLIDQARFLAFDTSRDGRIELEEFRKVFTDAITRVGAFPPPIPDPSRAGVPGEPEPGNAPEPPSVSATTVEELFGRIEERDDGPEALPRPARLVGPVPVFRRLDFDDDGLISVLDLLDLGRPIAHPVRVRALIAILDEDGDGGVSRAEFRRSMQSKP